MRLDEEQLDALTEIVNIGVGRAAASLSMLVEERIDLCVPRVRVCALKDLQSELENHSQPVDTSVVQGFSGEISGRAMLAFPNRSGVALAKLLSDDEDACDPGGEDLEFDLAGILEEIGNIVLNGVLGSLANVFEDDFQYTVPELCTGSASVALTCNLSDSATEASVANANDPTCLLADAQFELADSQVGGALLLAFNSAELSVVLDRVIHAVEA